MFILAGTCIFLSIVLGIMGLMAWGAMTTEPPTDDESNAEDVNNEPHS
jgi:hypothetical protein